LRGSVQPAAAQSAGGVSLCMRLHMPVVSDFLPRVHVDTVRRQRSLQNREVAIAAGLVPDGEFSACSSSLISMSCSSFRCRGVFRYSRTQAAAQAVRGARREASVIVEVE